MGILFIISYILFLNVLYVYGVNNNDCKTFNAFFNKNGYNLKCCDNIYILCNGNDITSITIDNSNMNGYDKPISFDSFPIFNNLIRLTITDNENSLANVFNGVLPKRFFELPNLEYLEVSNMKINTIPMDINNNNVLKEIVLTKNNISAFPYQFQNLSQLSKLDISFNSMTGGIDNQIKSFKNLKNLDINKNNMTGEANIPDSLEVLIINNNNFTTFGSTNSVEKLEEFKAINNNFDNNIFTSLFNTKNLKSIILNGNKRITQIPDDIYRITSLENFDISSTSIKELPPNFFALCNLVYLNISDNPQLKPIMANFCRKIRLCVFTNTNLNCYQPNTCDYIFGYSTNYRNCLDYEIEKMHNYSPAVRNYIKTSQDNNNNINPKNTSSSTSASNEFFTDNSKYIIYGSSLIILLLILCIFLLILRLNKKIKEESIDLSSIPNLTIPSALDVNSNAPIFANDLDESSIEIKRITTINTTTTAVSNISNNNNNNSNNNNNNINNGNNISHNNSNHNSTHISHNNSNHNSSHISSHISHNNSNHNSSYVSSHISSNYNNINNNYNRNSTEVNSIDHHNVSNISTESVSLKSRSTISSPSPSYQVESSLNSISSINNISSVRRNNTISTSTINSISTPNHLLSTNNLPSNNTNIPSSSSYLQPTNNTTNISNVNYISSSPNNLSSINYISSSPNNLSSLNYISSTGIGSTISSSSSSYINNNNNHNNHNNNSIQRVNSDILSSNIKLINTPQFAYNLNNNTGNLQIYRIQDVIPSNSNIPMSYIVNTDNYNKYNYKIVYNNIQNEKRNNIKKNSMKKNKNKEINQNHNNNDLNKFNNHRKPDPPPYSFQ
ncbi:L domain-like protein [Anaeromyces robustus]|uniref:L domain-like protein n=1 Tax=Anaeromyces robustus TaxID=1754192 RepID=A0A1Y1VX68_9FUNG|nr:L domain-like protein [Anaeromyces robustus]|eukprot:ORX65586.1 L domain-like protein [Anaeromyces robustus]